MNNQIYAVFLDIDGTLMSRGQIHPKNIENIAVARRLGHKVFINTGRSYACIPYQLLEKLQLDGVVAGIGSYVRFGDQIIKNVIIPQALLQNMTDYFLKTKIPCIFEGEEKMLYMQMDGLKNLEGELIIDAQHNFTNDHNNVRITKVTMIGQLSEADIQFLESDFTIFQHEDYAEIAVKGCSKAGGMQLMLNHIALGRENSIAMGDSANDLDMLAWAGISIAMANASDEVKAICDHVTDAADQAGVAAALEKFVF